jgi:hypothetical protein
MKGSIRVVLGLIIVMSAAGGIDIATDLQLIPTMALAAVGLFIMTSGVKAMD